MTHSLVRKAIWLGLMSTTALSSFSVHAQVSGIEMARVGRIYNFGDAPERLKYDIKDGSMSSPKSVKFSADGTKIYINSLEGARTHVYSWPSLKKIKNIEHNFKEKDADLFNGETTVFNYPYYTHTKNPNVFLGKPVESELTHGGRWLWIPYYRREYDTWAQSPSAVAIIDTTNDKIVRVMPTGPLPKYVAGSPDGKYAAVVHWGDNTIGIIDTSTGHPQDFRYISHLVVEKQMSQEGVEGTSRDSSCGFCLRGTVFTPDSQYLLVARMSREPGISAFHVPSGTYLGNINNLQNTPRHVVISPDGNFLYVSSNGGGYVTKMRLNDVMNTFIKAKGRSVSIPQSQKKEVYVGKGARTLDVSSDGRALFVAVNESSEVVAVDTATMKVVTRMSVDPFAVGLAIAPDDSAVLLTSQGKPGRGGGNAVDIFSIRIGPDAGTGVPLR